MKEMCTFWKRLTALTAAMCISTVAQAIDFPEVEPNETKAQANIIIPMQAGDTITGTTTGTSTTVPGAASADTFRICPATPPFGVAKYCWRLRLRSSIVGHSVTIRGLNQSAGVPGTTDTTVQTGRIETGTNDRIIQWYSFGRPGEDIYVRVTGSATTTAPYIMTLECTRVLLPTEPPQPGVPQISQLGGVGATLAVSAQPVQVFPDAVTDTALDTDWLLFDQNFNAIPGADHDDPDATGEIFPATNGTFVSPSLPPGRYYIAFGNFNTASNLGSTSAANTFRTGAILDFPGTVANSSTTASTAVLTMQARNNTTLQMIAGSQNGRAAFDVLWYCFEIVPLTTPTPPTCSVSLAPTSAINDGTGTTTITCNVTPGLNPPSVTHIVSANLTAIGGGPAVPMVEGPPNTFTLVASVANGTPIGAAVITCNVQETAPLARTSSCNATLNVTSPPPANDPCSGAIGIAVPSVTNGSTQFATIDTGSPVCNAQTISAGGVWYRVVGNGNSYTADLCASVPGYDSRLTVYCGANGCSGLSCIGGNDDSCGLLSSVTWCTQPTAVYYILVHGFGAATGAFTLTTSDDGTPCTNPIACVPTGACCVGASTCSITTAAACANTPGGHYLGDNTTCSTTTVSYSNMYSSSPNAPIPDFNTVPGVVADTLVVPDSFAFTDVSCDVSILDHTFIGDLIITLSKGASSVVMWNRQCGGNNGMHVLFSDAGVAVVCAEPTVGEYLSANPLSAMTAEPSAGPWVLTVSDNAGIDVGTLMRWELRFNRTATTRNNCSCHGDCVADFDDGSGTGTPDNGVTIDDLLYYLAIFEQGVICADVDDGSGTGTPDMGVTIDDLLYYLVRFEEGC